MTAQVIKFGPHKAKKLAEEFKNTGKVSLSKQHLSDAKLFNDYLEYLNAESGHVYENDLVQIYRKFSPIYNVDQESIDKIKNEFTIVISNLKYKNIHISDEVVMISASQVDSVLISLAKYRTYNGSLDLNMLPDYELHILELLKEKKTDILKAIKDDSDSIFNFLQKHEASIKNISTGKIFSAYVMNLRDSILEVARMITEFCQE
jgi:Mg2+ and Co2+ transporter CorA